MFVIRKKLSASEITPPNVRWNADCECVQQTFDGGDTWVDAPGQDPRSSDAFRAPALTTSDPRCDAAANMLAKLHAAVDMAIAFDNSVRLAGELFALFALAMPALGVVVALFTIIADVLLALGAAAIEGAFTSDVYDQLLCVFYDHIDADGQMSDSQLSDIYSQIAADFDSTVQAVFGAVSSAAGPVGWSNAGALGTETGDCTTCNEFCYQIDFTITDGSGVGVEILAGVWSDGVGIVGHNFDPDNFSDAEIKWTFPEIIHVITAEFFFTKTASSGTDGTNNKYFMYPDMMTVLGTNTEDPTGTDVVLPISTDEDLAGIIWDNNSGTAAVVTVLQKLLIYYSGGTGILVPNC